MITYYSTIRISLFDLMPAPKQAIVQQIITVLFHLNKSTQYFLLTESPQKNSLGYEFSNYQLYKKNKPSFLLNSFDTLEAAELQLIVESEEFERGLLKILVANEPIQRSAEDALALRYDNFSEKFINIYLEADARWLIMVNVPWQKEEAIDLFRPFLMRNNS